MFGGNFANHIGMDFGMDPGWVPGPGPMMPLGVAGWGMYNPDMNNLPQQPIGWDQVRNGVEEYLDEEEEQEEEAEDEEGVEVAFTSHVSRSFAN